MEYPPLIDIVVMHQDPLVSIGLAASLTAEPGFEVTFLRNAADRVPDVPALRAGSAVRHVVVTDQGRGIDIVQESRLSGVSVRAAGAKVVILAFNDRERDIRAALDAGVHGYLVMGCGTSEVVDAVRTVAMGGRYLSLAAAQRMADSLMRERLTSREDDVLQLVVAGFCNKVIAKQLDIATGTVKSHVRSILEKLSATSRTQAAAIAADRGLIDRKLVLTGWQSRLRQVPSRRFPSTMEQRHAVQH